MLGFAADGLLLIIAGIALALAVLWLRFQKPHLGHIAPYAIMAGLTSLLVGKLMSFWQPNAVRPFVEKGVEAGAAYIDNPGFPSDHALLATVIVVAVYFLTPYKRTSYVLAVLVLIMSAARVMGLVHTPLDIVGGIVAGAAGAVWYLKARRDKALS